MSDDDFIWVIVVDAFERHISKWQVENSFDKFKEILKCDYIEGVPFDELDNFMLLDENAQITDGEKAHFEVRGLSLVNRALIVGVTHDGNWTSTRLDISDIEREVKFL